MNGVLVVDKPQGLTSHDVVAVARRSLGESRIGHTGTLDPLATGVLPLACGRATRLVRFMTSAEKHYDAVIRFGFTTDSYDVTGTEVSRSGKTPTRDDVESALRAMLGEHEQMPPAFSAKKIAGQRAYTLARRAEPVALRAVPVTLFTVDLLEFTGTSARVALSCSAGFYVRSFAHALGERVGTGACLETLRRTRSGSFDLSEAVTIEELQREPAVARARVVPLERLLPHLPVATLTEQGRSRVTHGQNIERVHVQPEDSATLGTLEAEWVRLLDGRGRLVALAQATEPSRQALESGATAAPVLHPAVVLF